MRQQKKQMKNFPNPQSQVQIHPNSYPFIFIRMPFVRKNRVTRECKENVSNIRKVGEYNIIRGEYN